jgi:hypothetical protein
MCGVIAGKYEMLTLENGDGFKHIPTQSSIGHGTVIEPVLICLDWSNCKVAAVK